MPSSKKSTHGTGPTQNGANLPMDAPEPEEPHDDVRTSPNERRRSAPRATDGPKVAPESGSHKRFSGRIDEFTVALSLATQRQREGLNLLRYPMLMAGRK